MIDAHKPEFDALAARIHEIRDGRPALFFINPGNWGDSVIREGAEAFLRAHGVPYLPLRMKDFVRRRLSLDAAREHVGHPNPVVIYNGCGAFTPHYELGAKIASLFRNFETGIVLPSTYAMDIDPSDFARETHFFARDRFESQKRLPSAPFCHDMAFFLKARAAEPTKDTGLLYRADREAPEGFEMPEGNRDISNEGRAYTPLDGFLEGIGQFRKVRTNRLHVGIASALLGRDTELSGNDYFKIRAIYDSSMREHFPHVSFT